MVLELLYSSNAIGLGHLMDLILHEMALSMLSQLFSIALGGCQMKQGPCRWISQGKPSICERSFLGVHRYMDFDPTDPVHVKGISIDSAHEYTTRARVMSANTQ